MVLVVRERYVRSEMEDKQKQAALASIQAA
jgi:hypothetical protein